MIASLSRVLSRIQEIQSLLGEESRPNEAFDAELQRCADRSIGRSGADGGPGSPNPGDGGQIDVPVRKTRASEPPSSLAPLIGEASARTGLSEELISAVIQAESGYRPDAVSRTGALGLMQLMPGTARSLGVDDPLDPRENILGGAEYLRQQLSHFGSVEKALAAYNAGPRAVEQFGGVPPFRETQNYVRRVLQSIRRLTNRRE